MLYSTNIKSKAHGDSILLKLQILYFSIALAISLSLGVFAAKIGGPVWVTGFLPPAMLGLDVASKAYKVGQKSRVPVQE